MFIVSRNNNSTTPLWLDVSFNFCLLFQSSLNGQLAIMIMDPYFQFLFIVSRFEKCEKQHQDDHTFNFCLLFQAYYMVRQLPPQERPFNFCLLFLSKVTIFASHLCPFNFCLLFRWGLLKLWLGVLSLSFNFCLLFQMQWWIHRCKWLS